jgi:A/G-specific adenine glycosylase
MTRLGGRVVRWQRAHGRNSLPWQNTRDPYRVWLSEIMLQQTQVTTVLDYYARFLARFPDVAALAARSWTMCWRCGAGWATTAAPATCTAARSRW